MTAPPPRPDIPQPRAYDYRLGPFTLTVARFAVTDEPDHRGELFWTTRAVHTPTGVPLAPAACYHGPAPQDPGPDATHHDLIALLGLADLLHNDAALHRDELRRAAAPLDTATYRLPDTDRRPRRVRYRFGPFTLLLADLGIHPDDRILGGRARTWRTGLVRDHAPVTDARTYRIHPRMDPDLVTATVIARYTATPDQDWTADLAAATAPLTLAHYRR